MVSWKLININDKVLSFGPTPNSVLKTANAIFDNIELTEDRKNKFILYSNGVIVAHIIKY